MGIDINKEGIDFLKSELGYQDIKCADILNDEIPDITEHSWDYLLMGEVLEHIDDPVLFLSRIKEKFSGVIGQLLITVPNAFAWLNVKYALKHMEFINSDHRYWFTPYTLGKILIRADIRVGDFRFCEYLPPTRGAGVAGGLGRIFSLGNFLRKRYPALRNVLVMEAEL